MYIFTLNFNPQNIPANWGEVGLGLPQQASAARGTVGLSQPQPSPLCSPGWGRQWRRRELGRAGAVLQRKNWAQGWGELPKRSPLCSVMELGAWKLAGAKELGVWEVGEEGRLQPTSGEPGWGLAGPLTDDLPRPPVARHASLGGPSVAAHLQANDVLALLQLALCEFPLVLLGFPRGRTGDHSPGLLAGCSATSWPGPAPSLSSPTHTPPPPPPPCSFI